VRVAFPAKSGSSLNGQDGDTVREDGETVLLGLSVKDLEARNGDNTSSNTVLVLQVLSSVNGNADFRTGRHNDDGGVRSVNSDVTTLETVLNGRVLELRKVLTGKSEDGRSVLGGKGRVVGSAGLVAVGGTPDHEVRQSTEVCKGLNRLVSRTIFTKTNGVVSGDPDNADLRQSRKTDGTGSIGNEVQESTTSGDDGTVSCETIHDGTHGVLTDTVAEVTTAPLTNAVLRGLEVNSSLPASVVGSSQISGTGEKLRKNTVDLLQDSLGQLTRCNGRIGGLVGGEALLPAFGKLSSKTSGQIGVLRLVFSGVFLEEVVPFLFLGSTCGGGLSVQVVDLLGDDEALGRVEAESLLDTLGVIGLEGVSVDTTGTLELGTETNGGSNLDNGGLVLNLLGLANGLLNALEVVVTILDLKSVPAIGFETLHDIFGESALGVTV
jgi:hypothetical protein